MSNTEDSSILDVKIYPHSVTLNANPVLPNKLYSIFDKTVFSVYLSIFSKKKDKDYCVYLSIVDLFGIVPATTMDKEFESLDSQDFSDFMKSVFVIFQPFERYVLNFEKDKELTLREFYQKSQEWLETINILKHGNN